VIFYKKIMVVLILRIIRFSLQGNHAHIPLKTSQTALLIDVFGICNSAAEKSAAQCKNLYASIPITILA